MSVFNTSPLVIEPATTANACLIWLHGLGADRFDFAPLLRSLQLPAAIALRCVLPQAPERAVTINGGWIMPAWYDIISVNPEREVAQADVAECAAYIQQLIDEQIAGGIEPSRIILAGFSQGGAVALHCAYRTAQQPLAGVIALSTYLLNSGAPASEANLAQTPLLYLHGQHDDVVPLSLGQHACATLSALGVSLAAYQHDGYHEVPASCLGLLQEWLSERLTYPT